MEVGQRARMLCAMSAKRPNLVRLAIALLLCTATGCPIGDRVFTLCFEVVDDDSDGYPLATVAQTLEGFVCPPSYDYCYGVNDFGECEVEADCDDSDPAANPDAEEVCNGRDDNCDSVVDEGCVLDSRLEVRQEAVAR